MTTTDALQIRRLLDELSPLIEEYTAAICPGCTDVCCRQRHSRFDERDLAYFACLDVAPPQRDPARGPDAPCERMGPAGCRDPRWRRPFRCTWYFCEPLLAALDAGPQRKARRLAAIMNELIACRST